MLTNDQTRTMLQARRDLGVMLKPAIKHATWQAAPLYRQVWAVAAATAWTQPDEWMRCDQLQDVSIPVLGIHGCNWLPHLQECERRGIVELHEGPTGQHHFRVLMAGLPKRFRHSRRKGGGIPANGMSVMRPGPFGNPFAFKPDADPIKPKDRYEAVLLYGLALNDQWDGRLSNKKIEAPNTHVVNRLRAAVREKLLVLLCVEHLSCMCPANQDCHVDALIRWLTDRVFGGRS